MSSYKLDIISQGSSDHYEGLPKHFLADTVKEAEKIYTEYESFLNGIAYSYSASTGLDRGDLFGEALLGLALARRDWDATRSKNFKTYAIYRIKDSLSEFVRINYAIVKVPMYIKKANWNLKILTELCIKHRLDPREFVETKLIPDCMSDREKDIFCRCLVSIDNSAQRAGVDYIKFISRVAILPSETIEEYSQPEHSDRENQMLEASLVVDQLKKVMNDDELCICSGIMEGKSYEEIGAELNKSASWVSNVMKTFREKVKDTL